MSKLGRLFVSLVVIIGLMAPLSAAAAFDPVITPIHDIQGAGTTTPMDGAIVTIEGVVVGDFQTSTYLNGFFVQEQVPDGDDNTSEGIFVFAPSAMDVQPGNLVQVSGTVGEFRGATELSSVSSVSIIGAGSVAPTVVTMPVDSTGAWEKYEGMLIAFDQDLYISEYFNFDRYNEVVLTTGRQYQPSQVHEPGSTAAFDLADLNARSQITLDDGRLSQNTDPTIHPDGDPFSLTHTFRGGDVLRGVTGVLHHGPPRSTSSITPTYRILPTASATYVPMNVRPAAPDRIQGQLRVATFNVLNYFTTIDGGPNVCGPTAMSDCRGADSQEEYDRQLAKLLAGIVALDADIIGLEEIENDVRDDDGSRAHDAILTLVEELNDIEGDGTWAWVGEPDTPQGATTPYNDYPVRNEIIYRTSAVSPVGAPQTIRDDAFDKTRPVLGGTAFFEPVGRPPLAQTFTTDKDQSGRGNRRAFTVVVNHFKSKGSSCFEFGDFFDVHQANCNMTRVEQAKVLLDFVEDLKQTSGDEDILIIGDLNSYAMEDPIDTIKAGDDETAGSGDDFTDLIWDYLGAESYGYLFSAQLGSLDHMLANASMAAQVRGVTVFHINADEPDILDYDTSFKSSGQAAFYEPLAYRTSDHDPVIVGIKLERQDH